MTTFLTRPRIALAAAAVAVALAGGALAQERENANRPAAEESTRVARSDAGLQTLEQYLENKSIRASKLIGMGLENRSGDNLGDVRDIARGAAQGQQMQLIVGLEGNLGDDQKLVAIPFSDIQVSEDGDTLYSNRTAEQLASMPTVTLDASNDAAGRSAAPSLGGRRVGDLLGAEVVGADGEKVGEVDDIVLSTAGADSVRAVLQVGGVAGIGEKRISLPLSELTVERTGDDEPTVQAKQNREALERMPEFEYEEQTTAL